ncbi:hypothetical protein M4D54_04695 [Brachybacterium sp. p3-SID1565]|uniref:Uncharacterized protein n=1 Tax=Brachybacterium epidermidis TaxID=2781983 RepID=A0ABR9VYA1_9MICO|nr:MULTISPECIES: hypothetical protein [Brachybacterium]MBE9402700.1 hypothetical protein [Brachybacterium epidermidis]MCT1384930.1 hypothetical protein [Brachybacterium sp. p3-SID1565]MCT1776622.1 hypothetical protein [Brachybacterium sp. p3-SID957]
MKNLTTKAILTATGALIVLGGGLSSASAYTSYLADSAGRADVTSTRTSYSVKDTKGDGYRVYGDFWLNTGAKRQLVTKAYNQTVSQKLSGSEKVASFRACLDRPVELDTCAKRQYI